ncbi:MAG: hypothetical protein LLF96_01045 [Eubacteriales bacterium]|nr:hypothetical protein [Eubacteriales bacterium]
MTKRLLTFFICLTLIAGCCLPALADVATLDRALSRWLDDANTVRFSASLQLTALLPFDDATIVKLNGVLRHITVDASLSRDGVNSLTAAQIAVDGEKMMDWTERLQDGDYTFATSLLPNRILTSAQGSPMAILTDAGETGETQATPENDAADAAWGVNTSDVAEAFSFPDAITELQGCYQALTDGIRDFATEKRANYSIKGIGTGKWSRIARLTAEQSETLLGELRAVLACGMDEAYRAEIAQMTFAKGFVVALYQNADKQDNCVYLKGTVAYPDGSRRNLLWQWAFSTNGLERKDTFKYDATKTTGTKDNRTITASCTQVSKSTDFSLACETETTLKRDKVIDTGTATIDLTGKKDSTGTLACQGNVGQTLSQTVSSATTQTALGTTVDLRLVPQDGGNTLSGTVTVQSMKDQTVQNELVWTLGADVAGVAAKLAATDDETATADNTDDSGVMIALIPAATETPAVVATDPPLSSLEQIAQDSQFQAAAGIGMGETQTAETSAYLVGSSPTGLTDYTVPETETTVRLDGATAATLQNILAEAAQNLAGQLLRALAALPAEDAALLGDGMTDADFAAFQALLGAL